MRERVYCMIKGKRSILHGIGGESATQHSHCVRLDTGLSSCYHPTKFIQKMLQLFTRYRSIGMVGGGWLARMQREVARVLSFPPIAYPPPSSSYFIGEPLCYGSFQGASAYAGSETEGSERGRNFFSGCPVLFFKMVSDDSTP